MMVVWYVLGARVYYLLAQVYLLCRIARRRSLNNLTGCMCMNWSSEKFTSYNTGYKCSRFSWVYNNS